MRKKVSILGSTGSIGFNTLKIFKNKKLFKINVLIADKNYNAICKQIKMFQPTIFVINNPQILRKVKNKFKKNKVKIISPNNIKKKIKNLCIAHIKRTITLNEMFFVHSN